ncbi:MAG TPA: hypothetical protein VG245_01880 [Candidatus Dormibacteraeota bacterium]|jgi:hypothetical protein|nr:hypothetical protein [Candidatus Dormibacteraeota bacterium]
MTRSKFGLRLHRETVRELAAEDLGAAGAGPWSNAGCSYSLLPSMCNWQATCQGTRSLQPVCH